MKNAKELYEKREKAYRKLFQKQNKAANRISNLRLAVFLAGVMGVILLYTNRLYILWGVWFIAAAFLFGYLIVRHQHIIENKKYSNLVEGINRDSIKRLTDGWKSFTDTGEEFRDENHSYSGDLDIFGEGSLFQFINTARTYIGRQKLKEILVNPVKTLDEIGKRQQAVKELAGSLKWRQRFMAEGMTAGDVLHNPGELLRWAEERYGLVGKSWRVILIRALPVLTAVLILLTAVLPWLHWYVPALGIAVQFMLLKYKNRERTQIFKTTAWYKDNIKIYNRMLKMMERKKFTAQYLLEIQSKLINKEKYTASQQIKQLEKWVDSISNRYNAFYILFDVLTLWDYQCLISLENWKEKSGRSIRQWLEAVGEMEAAASLAVLQYDHPQWAIPVIQEKPAGLKTVGMGHPLLGEDRVTNDLHVEQGKGILLITGSNMSGKSTLLRTAGINLVLAYAGAPVCAGSFQCVRMDIHTCMRVSDNLQKSISSFYAELIRIRMIVRAAQDGKQIFFLLDEIFKGTNSRDRHTGARILIQQLMKYGAIGMVSTHDLELGDLEIRSGGKIKNLHFMEYYKNNEIRFDYKLRPGISQTRNAIHLMKIAGIEFENLDE